MREYQVWGILLDGKLAYANIVKAKSFGKLAAQREAERWVTWAIGYCAANPGKYPLHDTVDELTSNPLVAILYYPVFNRTNRRTVGVDVTESVNAATEKAKREEADAERDFLEAAAVQT